jgi:hypothetical protein
MACRWCPADGCTGDCSCLGLDLDVCSGDGALCLSVVLTPVRWDIVEGILTALRRRAGCKVQKNQSIFDDIK